jgi:hypothetical protein
MAERRKSSRRAFLKGRATLDALEDLTERLAGDPVDASLGDAKKRTSL